MESQEFRTRFHQFCNLVHLFLDINLIFVSRELIPEEYLDQALTPEGICRSYDSILFGGMLFQCPPKTLYQNVTPFTICFCALELDPSNGFAVLGPYLPDVARGGETLDSLLVRNGISLTLRAEYQAYLERLPVINQSKLRAVIGGMLSHVYGEELALPTTLHEIYMTKVASPPVRSLRRMPSRCGRTL